MFGLLSMIAVPIGGLIGGAAGVGGSIYLLFFFGMEHISKTAADGSYTPILSYCLLLLCSKLIICICGILGAALGCVPGFIGMYIAENG